MGAYLKCCAVAMRPEVTAADARISRSSGVWPGCCWHFPCHALGSSNFFHARNASIIDSLLKFHVGFERHPQAFHRQNVRVSRSSSTCSHVTEYVALRRTIVSNVPVPIRSNLIQAGQDLVVAKLWPLDLSFSCWIKRGMLRIREF